MFAVIENWQQSGQSKKEFCKQHNLATHVFYYWYSCYRKQNNTLKTQPTSDFIELHSTQPLSAAAAIEVLLNNGNRIYFHQPVSATFIKALIF